MTEQKEILESIRDIIAGKKAESENDGDILDLTQMVNEDGSVTTLAPNKPQVDDFNEQPKNSIQMPEIQENDILSEIDQMLAANDKPETGSDEKIELELAPKTEKFDIAEEFSKAEELAKDPNGFEPPIVPRDADQKKLDSLISENSASQTRAAISQLTSRFKKEERPVHTDTSAPFRSGSTVEDLVIEMLKPMMKDWLDNNLPILVNEIVQKEIQKLIPKD